MMFLSCNCTLNKSFIDKFDINSVISIVAIFANIILAIWLVSVFNKRALDKRALKDYLIKELFDARDHYSKMMNDLITGKKKHLDIIFWFKVMNIRMINIHEILKEKNIPNFEAKELIQKLRTTITSSVQFNNSFTSNSFNPNFQLQSDILVLHKDINKAFLKAIVNINEK